MPQGYGGKLSDQEVLDLNAIFADAAANITDKHIRKQMEQLHKALQKLLGDGVITDVNWNS